MSQKVIIIAEAGVNHNASIEKALKLVDVAVHAGADYVKFQTAIPELVVTSSAPKAEYQKILTGLEETQLEMTKRIHLALEDFNIISDYCSKKGIKFLSTAFDLVSVEFLYGLGQKIWKIPSGEITNLPYLRSVANKAKEIILSTGMSTMTDIENALNVLYETGFCADKVTILHCNTEYPTPMNDVNLLAMQSIKDKFGVSVGYSDHTLGIEVAIAAAAMGAKVIEKHFTLDRGLPGPDHKASLEPDELKAMITGIRNIEVALGDGIKRLSQSEEKNRPIARKSLVAACPINIGEVFTEKNLTVKRPGTGLSPMLWDEVIGQESSRNYKADELIVL